MWDPDQYRRFAGERGRPFAELVTRTGAAAPQNVVDLGCGPGDRMRRAYPPRSFGTVLPFRRVFVGAQRPG